MRRSRVPMPARTRWLLAPLLLGAAVAQPAQAARPMATDDTGTSPAGECLIEAWSAREDQLRTLTATPACGLTDQLELDAGIGRTNGAGVGVDALWLGLKWVPEAARWATPLGELQLGVIGGVDWARDSGSGWRGDGAALAGLASLQLTPQWALYLNAIGTRERQPSRWSSGTRAALGWQPDERWILFVETLHSHQTRPVRNAGARLWLLPEVLGLDLVFTRAGGDHAVSLGFGWYGIFGR